MKNACFSFLSILLALTLFTACSTPDIVAEFGESLQIERPDSNKNNDTSASKGQPQTNEEISNSKAIVQSLGSLLAQNWDTPKILTSTDIVMWYAEHLKEQHPEEELYLSRYAVDGKEGFRFPQEELEYTTEQYFGIKPEQLQTDKTIYNLQGQVYITPTAIGNLPEKQIEITEVEESHLITIHFNLTIEGAPHPETKALTVKPGNPVQYLSLKTTNHDECTD
ncbi:hypothetical protein EDD70_2852 [Hydrogenoanaerobacterium saccharovorans]|uniref:Lipoprotein n=1 Tax=Hydrogenoanaerobacterium saccharovorans TaxID=474960 RepID=A0A1H8E319_9FIRM|nr:hypothetical protein [Hydrogenoanaerobacterium saccharovorans]RPF42109.1 hypothetical protein EDD70_2852 [Hydrogenoanaerobacterium saccharovorans]SEN13833.1 hypothetical protein SAMN05216180_2868 [Hydrogenoanaerobacterium saccharovorans]